MVALSCRYLVKFLSKLAHDSEANKMTPSNIAIVLGPNLLWAKTEGWVWGVAGCGCFACLLIQLPIWTHLRSLAEMAAATSVHVVAIVEPIIQHANWFFPEGELWLSFPSLIILLTLGPWFHHRFVSVDERCCLIPSAWPHLCGAVHMWHLRDLFWWELPSLFWQMWTLTCLVCLQCLHPRPTTTILSTSTAGRLRGRGLKVWWEQTATCHVKTSKAQSPNCCLGKDNSLDKLILQSLTHNAYPPLQFFQKKFGFNQVFYFILSVQCVQ